MQPVKPSVAPTPGGTNPHHCHLRRAPRVLAAGALALAIGAGAVHAQETVYIGGPAPRNSVFVDMSVLDETGSAGSLRAPGTAGGDRIVLTPPGSKAPAQARRTTTAKPVTPRKAPAKTTKTVTTKKAPAAKPAAATQATATQPQTSGDTATKPAVMSQTAAAKPTATAPAALTPPPAPVDIVMPAPMPTATARPADPREVKSATATATTAATPAATTAATTAATPKPLVEPAVVAAAPPAEPKPAQTQAKPVAPAPTAGPAPVTPSAAAPRPSAAPTAAPAATQMAALPPTASVPSGSSSQTMRVSFASENATLPDAAKAGLKKVAEQLSKDAALRVQVMAYATGSDDPGKARRLSLSRALAVRGYLIEQGVGSTRIDVRALGNNADGGPSDRADLILLSR